MLEKLEKFNQAVCSWFELIGFAALFAMVILTCVDVLGAKLLRMPVFGALDIMMLLQLIAMSFGVSMALIAGRHVHVEFFVMLCPKRPQALMESVVRLICLALFILIVWRLFVHGQHLAAGGEESATNKWPMAPFAYAAAVGMIPMCLVLLHQFLDSVLRVIKHES
ncbi:MAG: TRAP transporter small permease [Deferrisomatales bacterium]|nr:TRAP transporter small permease [Deferrisomatales bacterium]